MAGWLRARLGTPQRVPPDAPAARRASPRPRGASTAASPAVGRALDAAAAAARASRAPGRARGPASGTGSGNCTPALFAHPGYSPAQARRGCTTCPAPRDALLLESAARTLACGPAACRAGLGSRRTRTRATQRFVARFAPLEPVLGRDLPGGTRVPRAHAPHPRVPQGPPAGSAAAAGAAAGGLGRRGRLRRCAGGCTRAVFAPGGVFPSASAHRLHGRCRQPARRHACASAASPSRARRRSIDAACLARGALDRARRTDQHRGGDADAGLDARLQLAPQPPRGARIGCHLRQALDPHRQLDPGARRA